MYTTLFIIRYSDVQYCAEYPYARRQFSIFTDLITKHRGDKSMIKKMRKSKCLETNRIILASNNPIELANDNSNGDVQNQKKTIMMNDVLNRIEVMSL